MSDTKFGSVHSIKLKCDLFNATSSSDSSPDSGRQRKGKSGVPKIINNQDVSPKANCNPKISLKNNSLYRFGTIETSLLLPAESLDISNLETDSNDRSITEHVFSNSQKLWPVSSASLEADSCAKGSELDKTFADFETYKFENLPFERPKTTRTLCSSNQKGVNHIWKNEHSCMSTVSSIKHATSEPISYKVKSKIEIDLCPSTSRLSLNSFDDKSKELTTHSSQNSDETKTIKCKSCEDHFNIDTHCCKNFEPRSYLYPEQTGKINLIKSSEIKGNESSHASRKTKEIGGITLINNSSQNLEDCQSLHVFNNIKGTYFFNKLESDISSLTEYAQRNMKPLKISSNSNSKSIHDINNINKENFNETKSLSFTSSQSTENIYFASTRSDSKVSSTHNGNENVNKPNKSVNKLEKKADKNKVTGTTPLCQDASNTQNYGPKLASPNQLIRHKSYSLNNLISYRKLSFSHVQSKVKQYIMEKKHQDLNAKLESISLPATPLKNTQKERDVLSLDVKTLESLSMPNIESAEQELPEDLKPLRYEMLDNTQKLAIFETLFNKLKKERQSRIEQDTTLNALQLDFDNLLAKYAQAENLIDSLRLYKDIHLKNISVSDKYIDGSGRCGSTKSYFTAVSNCPKFKKALSTSNILQEYSFTSSPVRSNLIKYSSSPVVNPTMSLTFKAVENNFDGYALESPTPLRTNDVCSSESPSTCISPFNNDLEHSFSEWTNKCEDLSQKLYEYSLLEANSALNEDERNLIWNMILEKHSDLLSELHLYNETPEHLEQRKKFEELCQTITAISNKIQTYGTNLISSKFAIENSMVDCVDLPAGKSDPVYKGEGVADAVTTIFNVPMTKETGRDKYVQVAQLPIPLDDTSEVPLMIGSDHTNPVNDNSLSKDSIYSSNQPQFSNVKEKLIDESSKSNLHSDILKHHSFKIRDVDSGCPPSDRSTKNSQYPSIDQSDFFALNQSAEQAFEIIPSNSGYNMLSLKSGMHDSGFNNELFKIRPNYRRITLPKVSEKVRFDKIRFEGKNRLMNNYQIEEEYDASSSSEAYEETGKIKKVYRSEPSLNVKRSIPSRLFNRNTENWMSDSKVLEKFEDKFVCGYKSDIADLSGCSSQSIIGKHSLSHFEKSADHFKVQVNVLKSKGFHRAKNVKIYSKTSSTPLKALRKSPFDLTKSILNPDSSSSFQSDENYIFDDDSRCVSSDSINSEDLSNAQSLVKSKKVSKQTNLITDGYKRCSIITSKEKTNSGHRNVPINDSMFPYAMCALPTSNSSFDTSTPKSKRVFSSLKTRGKNCIYTSTPRSSDSQDTNSIPVKTAKKHLSSNLSGKSKSVPSLQGLDRNLPAPIIYIEQYNSKEKCDGHSACSCNCCCKQCNLRNSNSVCSNLSRKGKHAAIEKQTNYPDLLASLNEATTLAEKVRLRSQTVLRFLHTDLLQNP